MGCGPSSKQPLAEPGCKDDKQKRSQGQSVVLASPQNIIWKTNYDANSEGYYRGEILVDDDLSYLLELHFSCTALPNLDRISKSDPICILYEQNKNTKLWEEKGRTEVIYDSLNPQFIQSIYIRYRFEERQNLKIEVYDIDDDTALEDLSKQELVGSTELYVHQIVREKEKGISTELSHIKRPNRSGNINIWGEQVDPTLASQLVILEVSAELTKSQYFYQLYRNKGEDTIETVPIFRSEVKNGGNFKWNNARILSSVLCRNDFGKNIQIEIFQWVDTGDHKSLYKQDVQLFTLNTTPVILQFDQGSVTLMPYSIHREYSFMEYLNGGLEISLEIAVDFTLSNGVPTECFSLHSDNGEYLQAIEAVGSVVEPYDYDGLISLLGFGGRYQGSTSHCYPISAVEGAKGISGVVKCYKDYLKNARLSAPTYFTPIIKNASDKAMKLSQSNPNGYLILMILTDGIYDDEYNAIDQIVAASRLPLSIITVGVGSSDFQLLEKLDADTKPLKSTDGTYMARDIVQFVPFSQFKDQPQQLASHTLAEIPSQIITYMNKVGNVPLKH